MSIVIKEVSTEKELREFVKFSIELYKDNPYYVPELITDEMEVLSKDKNPAFELCDAVYFLAYREGKIVGRIAGIINRPSNEVWKEEYARFGFVDFIDDAEVVDALFNAVEKWAVAKGMKTLHGPLGFTDMDNEGMLVDGFDQLGTMATIYNYPYYPVHMERMGFVKDQDWHEFKIYIPDGVPEKHLRIGEIVKKKYGLKVRKFKNAKEIMPYVQRIFEALNAAFAPLYGFAPLSQKQIDYYVKKYIPMLRFELVTVIIREEDDAVVGFGISLPNMSKALQKARGRMLPFGWYYLLKALLSKPKVVDLYLAGVLPEYQGKGVNALLFNDLIPIYKKIGTVYAESNPELETNNAVQAQWDYFKREHHKTRRAFIKHLTTEN
jgi:GNAT superfamily N-acetyltransferase